MDIKSSQPQSKPSTTRERERAIEFSFRWPVNQIGEREIAVLIPLGSGPLILNPEFVQAHRLADSEIEACETHVLREIAIIK